MSSGPQSIVECKLEQELAPSDLLTLSSRRLSGTCTFTMDSHAAIYSGYLV
ncbi:unnamed protein product, partial [Symbiodinium sp. KB8]